MNVVPIDKMKDQLVTLTEVRNRLSKTEPLSTEFLSIDSKIKFQLQPDWAMDFDNLSDTDPVDAEVTINGKATQLSKEALLLAGSNMGLPKALMRRNPSHINEQFLNYWYGGGLGDKSYNMLTVKDIGSAFIAPTRQPYSNLSLLDNVISGIQNVYGDEEVYADYKFNHSLQKTDVRLIVPTHSRVMQDTNMKDVPEGAADSWSAGIHLSNSLIGKTQTSVDSYLFRWWCTNGAITRLDDVGTWNRRHEGASEIDVFEWARQAVEDVLGGMEDRFDDIQALAHTNISGNTTEVLRELYTEFNIPVTQRSLITEQLLEAETLTMYSLMNAITQTANESGLDPERADRMMRIGGFVPTATFENIKAKVFHEGQLAGPQAPNKYAFGVSQ